VPGLPFHTHRAPHTHTQLQLIFPRLERTRALGITEDADPSEAQPLGVKLWRRQHKAPAQDGLCSYQRPHLDRPMRLPHCSTCRRHTAVVRCGSGFDICHGQNRSQDHASGSSKLTVRITVPDTLEIIAKVERTSRMATRSPGLSSKGLCRADDDALDKTMKRSYIRSAPATCWRSRSIPITTIQAGPDLLFLSSRSLSSP
jgi:hypothetical protein